MFIEHSSQAYYDNIPRHGDFALMAEPQLYMPLPDDWYIGVADIVGSTHEISRGRYKIVNMVGAAVIAAQLNAAGRQALPYVFGGDGAGFAVWPTQRGAAERALNAVRRWARAEYGVELRVAMVSVARIRAEGRDLRVARYAPENGVDYAMFAGGGLAWAEAEMKAGRIGLAEGEDAPEDLDLSGLSCRWSNMKARNGAIVSLVVLPRPGVSEDAFASVAHALVTASSKEGRGGHPVPQEGPGVAFPPPGLTIEARVRQKGSYALRVAGLLISNAFLWALMKSGVKLGQFDPKAYRAQVASNADYRKFDDGLKMTLDCDAQTQARMERILRAAEADGLVRFGLHAQEEAMMTCLVHSPTEAGHMHFVDGAAGGYARAARNLRLRTV
ncbi:DUF3095 domain-containing protein [Shimia sp. R11_0]|uniref:DUF3095 domain-containing protein n=1 Tax=Shimia sp. R11_0 TaxID=2821096 RepID=UPI001ADCFB92|nr:DUF3095 domain-containing protein [Shimia sp. R11_0]MBO9478940.1 DUF3095 domain-containing protein [Shimia sp. R11_0]